VRPSSALVGSRHFGRIGLAPHVLLGILAATLAAAPALGQPPISAKRAEAARVFTQVQGLNASLGRADERVNLANIKLAHVQHEVAVNRYELRVAKRNLKRSQKVIAQRLVTLYTSPQTSTLEVILGAVSLDDMLVRVDTANRVSSLDAEVLSQVNTFKSAVRRHGIALAKAQRETRRLVAVRAAERQSIANQLAERQRLLSSIRGQIASLEAEQRARELREARAARSSVVEAQAATQQDFTAIFGGFGASDSVATDSVATVPSSGYSGVVGVAMSYLGTPYAWGGSSPGGFDCSGLVSYAYSRVGVSLPHSSYALWNVGTAVPRDQLEPGDLVFFDGLGHVGIYIGGGQFVHAPHTGDVVKVSSLDGGYGYSYVGARRIL
jgi:cell wall-associated NlpC family hydrolase